MRHALAPGTGDPAAFELRDCATQRNLDARGRAQAVATGQMIRDAGIRIDAVLSSQWCRCLDTARLLDLGPVIEEPALNSFFRDRARGRPQTDDLLAR
ncbi:MAG: histidine phosphatase family protein, partial [Pseudomonadota bacterium]